MLSSISIPNRPHRRGTADLYESHQDCSVVFRWNNLDCFRGRFQSEVGSLIGDHVPGGRPRGRDAHASCVPETVHVAIERRRGERRRGDRRINPGAAVDVTRLEHESLLGAVAEILRSIRGIEGELQKQSERLGRVETDLEGIVRTGPA